MGAWNWLQAGLLLQLCSTLSHFTSGAQGFNLSLQDQVNQVDMRPGLQWTHTYMTDVNDEYETNETYRLQFLRHQTSLLFKPQMGYNSKVLIILFAPFIFLPIPRPFIVVYAQLNGVYRTCHIWSACHQLLRCRMNWMTALIFNIWSRKQGFSNATRNTCHFVVRRCLLPAADII